MKPLVILRAGNAAPEVAARRGEYAGWIRAAIGDAWGGEWVEHDVRTDTPLPDPRAAAGFIMTGSSSSVTERAPWMLRAEAHVRAITDARTPLLGVCFGHQLIAQALGGLVAKNPFGREIGTVDVARTGEDALFGGLPETLRVSATHVDAVVRAPEGARVLGTTSKDPVAAFAVGDAVRGVQFHPEFDGDVMRGYIRARAHLIDGEGLDFAGILAAVSDDLDGPTILRNFITRLVIPAA